jgi:hypothetical protein
MIICLTRECISEKTSISSFFLPQNNHFAGEVEPSIGETGLQFLEEPLLSLFPFAFFDIPGLVLDKLVVPLLVDGQGDGKERVLLPVQDCLPSAFGGQAGNLFVQVEVLSLLGEVLGCLFYGFGC